jgi:hypothetical protein
VPATRKACQNTMGPQMIAAIERHSGRRVFAFLSDNHIDPDVAIQSFVLVPVRDSALHDNGSATAAR